MGDTPQKQNNSYCIEKHPGDPQVQASCPRSSRKIQELVRLQLRRRRVEMHLCVFFALLLPLESSFKSSADKFMSVSGAKAA